MLDRLKKVEEIFGPREFNRVFNISLKHKFLYAQTPKVASSTLKHTLHIFALEGSGVDVSHIPRHPGPVMSPFIKPFQLPDDMLAEVLFGNEFKRFCFVREPYGRILSSYLDKICGNAKEKKGILRNLGRDVEDMEQEVTFTEFVELISEFPSRKMDHHWRPQFDILRPDKVSYDFVGRLENFDEDTVKLEGIIGIPLCEKLKAVVPHKTAASSKVAQYYDDHLKSLVKKRFEADFVSFGYEM